MESGLSCSFFEIRINLILISSRLLKYLFFNVDENWNCQHLDLQWSKLDDLITDREISTISVCWSWFNSIISRDVHTANWQKNTKSESWESGELDFEDARSWGFVYLEIWPYRMGVLKSGAWQNAWHLGISGEFRWFSVIFGDFRGFLFFSSFKNYSYLQPSVAKRVLFLFHGAIVAKIGVSPMSPYPAKLYFLFCLEATPAKRISKNRRIFSTLCVHIL